MEEKGVNPPEIKGLLVRFQGGEEGVFSELCDRYTPMLTARVYYYFGNNFKDTELDFDEMVQDARYALYRAAGKYALDNGKVTFGYYARACVNNALSTYCRDHKKRAPLESIDEIDELLFAENDNPIDSLIAEEKLADLYLKISTVLTPLEHRVFDMYIEGESTESMAKKLALGKKSVSNALYRMLKKLREAL